MKNLHHHKTNDPQSNNMLQIAENITVKICHDLAGQVGSIHNALELFNYSEDTALKAQSLALATKAAQIAKNILSLYRYAFGSNFSDTQKQFLDAHKMVTDFFASSAIEYQINKEQLDDFDAFTLPTAEIRLIIIMLLVAQSVIMKQGSLNASFENNKKKFTIDLQAPRINTSILSILEVEWKQEDHNNINHHNIEAYFATQLAHQIDAKIYYKHISNLHYHIVINFKI